MKIAIVTGASAGMGREAAIQIGDRFNGIEEIWIIARREDRLKELALQIPKKVRCFAIDLSVSEDSLIREDRLGKQGLAILKEALLAYTPDVKFLINAAGYGKIGPVGTIDRKTESGMVVLNCQALCAVTLMVLPYMSDNSRMIQFASAAAFVPQPKFAIYAATKAFVLSYSRALNEELKPRGICVTAVCPGPVKTEFFDIAETSGKIPLYKMLAMADPEKVVRLALRDSMMGKSMSVYGIFMKLFLILCKVCPHQLIFNVMTGGKNHHAITDRKPAGSRTKT